MAAATPYIFSSQ